MSKLAREARIAKAKRLRAMGMSYEEIGRKFGVTYGAISYWLKGREARRKAIAQMPKPLHAQSSSDLNGFASLVKRYHEAKAFVCKFENAMKGLEG